MSGSQSASKRAHVEEHEPNFQDLDEPYTRKEVDDIVKAMQKEIQDTLKESTEKMQGITTRALSAAASSCESRCTKVEQSVEQLTGDVQRLERENKGLWKAVKESNLEIFSTFLH